MRDLKPPLLDAAAEAAVALALRQDRPGDAFDPACPTRAVLDRIGDRWAVLILLSLRDGPLRFNALQRRVRGISQKMLSRVLKGLERDGLVIRTAFATVPVTVEYALTPLSFGLIGILASIAAWAEANIVHIEAARRAHDTRGA